MLTRAASISEADLISVYSQGNQALRAVAISRFLSELGLRNGGKEFKQLTTINSNQVLSTLDDLTYLLVDASGAPVTITLPTAVGRGGDWLSIKKADATGNAVTIAPFGTELIDQDASLVLSGFNRPSVEIISDGVDWWVLNA
jgi:hypothetical protein